MKIAVTILAALVVVGLGTAVYFGFIRPHTKPTLTTSSQQEADNITNYEYSYYPKVSFGCINFKLLKIDDREKDTIKSNP